jgi:hypothetical protein
LRKSAKLLRIILFNFPLQSFGVPSNNPKTVKKFENVQTNMSEHGAAKGVAGSRLGNTPLPHENQLGTSPVSPTSGEWKSHILGGCTLQDYSSCQISPQPN